MDLTGKKILVVGLARTGVALARFLAQAGARVTVTDVAKASDLAAMPGQIQDLPVTEELGVPSEPRDVSRFDLILPSPGVPPELPWLEQARQSGIPVWGELELASHFINARHRGDRHQRQDHHHHPGARVPRGQRRQSPWWGETSALPGDLLLGQQDQADCLVLEVSSFQLDTAPSFHPQAAALFNITPDHLDRYADYCRLCRLQGQPVCGHDPGRNQGAE